MKQEDLRRLSKLSYVPSVLAILVDWGAILGILYLNVRFYHPVLVILSILLMARFQYALFIVLHDAAHSLLFKSKKVNDFVGQLVVAPIFLSLRGYRKHHLLHHRVVMSKEDPDLSLTGGYPITRASFRRKITRDAVGISYFRMMPYYLGLRVGHEKKGEGQPNISWWYVAVGAAFQIGLFFWLWESGHPWLYLFLWVLPMISPLQVFLRVRGITEHAGYQANENQALNSRTVINPFETFFLAPHQVFYHIEHHLYPSIPFYHLSEAHRLLKAEGRLPPANVYRSYREVIRELVK